MNRRMTMKVRRQAELAGIARREWLLQMLALGAAVSCRRSDDPAYARGNTLVMAVRSVEDVKPDITELDFLPFPRLAAMDDKGDLQPLLAQSWEHSADYLQWTYHLRTDVHWSDGVPVTAHDIKFTLDLLMHPDVHQYYFDNVTVIDDYTVKIRARGRLNGYAQDDISYFPKHVLEHLEPKKFYDWDFWLHPTVSAGPYRFVRYVPETMMEFEANPTYFLSKPNIERVVLQFAGGAGLNELFSGHADIVQYADPAQTPRVTEDPRFRAFQTIRNGAMGIYWKCDHPLFRDSRVRRALTLAIDRHALLGVLNLPSDFPITDGIFTPRQVLRRQFPEPLPYDPAQARELLEAAGWQDHDGDGVRERDGRPFRFTALVNNSGAGYDRLAIYVQAQYRQLGVQMEILLLDNALVRARLGAGTFEAVFNRYFDDLSRNNYHYNRNNRLGYQNSEVFRLTAQAVATADPDELDRIYREYTEILRDDLPVTRLLPLTSTTFAHRRVHGPGTPFLGAPDRYMGVLSLENER